MFNYKFVLQYSIVATSHPENMVDIGGRKIFPEPLMSLRNLTVIVKGFFDRFY